MKHIFLCLIGLISPLIGFASSDTFTGYLPSVNVANSNKTQVIVRNASGNVVLNTQFVGYTAQQLNATGAHTIEIHNGGMTLVGQFQAQ